MHIVNFVVPQVQTDILTCYTQQLLSVEALERVLEGKVFHRAQGLPYNLKILFCSANCDQYLAEVLINGTACWKLHYLYNIINLI